MPDISKLWLPEDVRPHWTDKGEPWCPRGEEVECPSLLGGEQRCSKTRIMCPTNCQPAIEAMARAVPGFLEVAGPQPSPPLPPAAKALEDELWAALVAKGNWP